jgi:putative restriction endonuclease
MGAQGFREALRAVSADPFAVNDTDLDLVTTTRKKVITSVLRSLRERTFRERVLNSYASRCAMCEVQLELVEAAHIVPVQVPGSTDETSNGLALCSLHHLAYDKALVTVTDDYHVLVSRREKRRLREIGQHEGMESLVENLRTLILLPSDEIDHPHVNYLRRGCEIRSWSD